MNKKLRKLILEAFKQPETHPKANDVYMAVKKEISDLDKDLFEKELEDLEKQGEISSIYHVDNEKHYHTRKDLHFHFLCEQCGLVKDIVLESGAVNMLKDHVQVLSNSFARVDNVNMSFTGICHECRKNS